MPVMAVNNENSHEQAGDYRARPRWSAGKKMDAVLRLLPAHNHVMIGGGVEVAEGRGWQAFGSYDLCG
jgi:hypothetical protein